MEEWESWRILIEFIMKRNRILALGGFIRVIHSGGTRPLPSQPFYSSSSHHHLSLDDEVCVAHAIEFVSIIYQQKGIYIVNGIGLNKNGTERF